MRYTYLTSEDMSHRQREVAEAISERSVEGLASPYAAMLYSPEMADRTHQLGEYLRSSLRLPERLRVLAVLMTVGWYHHQDLIPIVGLEVVQNSSLASAMVEALAKGETPIEMADDEAIVHAFISELLTSGRVKTPTFNETVTLLGREAALELVAVCGFSSMLRNVQNVTQSPAANVW